MRFAAWLAVIVFALIDVVVLIPNATIKTYAIIAFGIAPGDEAYFISKVILQDLVTLAVTVSVIAACRALLRNKTKSEF